MNYKLAKLKEAGQNSITLTIEEKDLTPFSQQILNDYRQKLNIPGFRKGKAPDNIILKHIDKTTFESKIMEKAVSNFYSKSLSKENIQPYGQAKMELQKETFPMKILLTFAIFPEVKLEDWQKISIVKPSNKISEKEIETEINAILEKNVEWQETVEAIKKTDKVEITFVWQKEDGTVFEKGNGSYPIVIGSGFFIPGFEEKLIGFKPGDKTEFTLTFPKDYHHKQFQGMIATFKVTINKVFNKKLPQLTDDFVTKLVSKKMTADNFKNLIKKQIGFKKQYYNNIDLENNLLNEISKKCILENLADQVINDEIEIILEEFEYKLKEQKITLEQYLKNNKLELKQLKKDWRPQAHQRLKIKFALTEIAKENNIQVSPKEVTDKIRNSPDFPKDAKKQVEYLANPTLISYAKRELIAFKTIKLIKDKITITEK